MIERRRTRARDATTDGAHTPPETAAGPTAVIAAVTHELGRRRSIVTLVRSNDPDKKLALPIPYGCSLAEVRAATVTAVAALAQDLASREIVSP